LMSLSSAWIETNSSGVPGVPVDCPSVANVMGAAGSCGPTCDSIVGFNSFTTAAFLQGACSAKLALGGEAVSVTSHRWTAFEVQRESRRDGHVVAASRMRLLNDDVTSRSLNHRAIIPLLLMRYSHTH
jgi:hypothetical protein